MHKYIISIIFAVLLLWTDPVWASVPYYNQDLGYTIWLSDGWEVAPEAHLSRFDDFYDGVNGAAADWEACYMLGETPRAHLLVSTIHGKVVSKAGIGNFNSFVVRQVQRLARDDREWRGPGEVSLKRANYDREKNMLRLEMEKKDPAGKVMTTVVYIVYTRTGMLKFVGLAEPGDTQSIKAIDAAVSSLYLDYALNL